MMIRHLCFAMFFGLFAMTSVSAQDGAQNIKYAKRALAAYQLSPSDNANKLDEALAELEKGYSSGDFTPNYKSELLKGEIYTELARMDFLKASLSQDGKYMPQNLDQAVNAVGTLQSALGMAEKKFEINQVLKVVAELAPYLSTLGNTMLSQNSFDKAYAPLQAVITANDLLTSNKSDSIFETAEDFDNHKYVTAVCAEKAGEKEVAMKYLNELADADSKEVGVYTTLFDMTIDEDAEKALGYLEKGRAVDPNNQQLLYAEINYYIKKQQYDVLSDKLKMAIEKEPDNPQMYALLGNVYTSLSDDAMKEGDMDKAEQYFNESKAYYEKTIELDPASFDAQYSIGSLYYNKAASMTAQMQDLGLSKEDQMKFEELQKSSTELFDMALPYFQKAEMLNPSDQNTIVALKEIFARKDDLETSSKFKERLDRIQNGETIEESFFK